MFSPLKCDLEIPSYAMFYLIFIVNQNHPIAWYPSLPETHHIFGENFLSYQQYSQKLVITLVIPMIILLVVIK